MTTATPGQSDTTTASQEESRQEGFRKIPPHTGVPAFLALLCGATYLWASSLQLDSLERRTLNYDYLQRAILEHVKLSVVSIALVILIAIPLGILLTRSFARWLTPVALGLANVGQATPAIGLLVLMTLIFGIGFKIALISIVAYAVLPVLRNTIVGINEVNPAMVEAAEGMGMGRWAVLFRIELPLAVPVIAAGVRIALVLVVAVATLATFVNAGGLGDILVTGIKLQRVSILVVGTVLAVTLALLADWLGGVIEDLLTPRGG